MKLLFSVNISLINASDQQNNNTHVVNNDDTLHHSSSMINHYWDIDVPYLKSDSNVIYQSAVENNVKESDSGWDSYHYSQDTKISEMQDLRSNPTFIVENFTPYSNTGYSTVVSSNNSTVRNESTIQ